MAGLPPCAGWSPASATSAACLRSLCLGPLALAYTLSSWEQVPYSEHSSFEELRQAVAWLQPRRLVPSVGNDGGACADDMVRMLRGLDQPPT